MTGARWGQLAVLPLALLAASVSAHPRWAVRAPTAFDGDGWIQDAVVVVHGDRIEAVGTDGDLARGVTVIELAEGVLTPGLLDLDASLGTWESGAELPEAVSPDLRVADAVEPHAAELAAFRRSGVTTAWISAAAAQVIGGRGALARPTPTPGGLAWTSDSWGLSASLTSASSVADRAPTSLPERARLLGRVLDGWDGQGPTRIRFDDAASARRASLLASALPVGMPSSEGVLAELATARGLIASGLAPTVGPVPVRAVVTWVARGGRLALGSGTSPAGPAAVRHAAARLVEEGLDADAALRTLTRDAAELAGLADRGRLVAGAAADLVIWSGHPTSPSSRPLRVWVLGEEVHRD